MSSIAPQHKFATSRHTSSIEAGLPVEQFNGPSTEANTFGCFKALAPWPAPSPVTHVLGCGCGPKHATSMRGCNSCLLRFLRDHDLMLKAANHTAFLAVTAGRLWHRPRFIKRPLLKVLPNKQISPVGRNSKNGATAIYSLHLRKGP